MESGKEEKRRVEAELNSRNLGVHNQLRGGRRGLARHAVQPGKGNTKQSLMDVFNHGPPLSRANLQIFGAYPAASTAARLTLLGPTQCFKNLQHPDPLF